MTRFTDAVLRVTKACKNRLKISNVYDCARPFLVFMGLVGIGGTWICQNDGVYAVRNSSISLLVLTFVSLIYTPYTIILELRRLFAVPDHPRAILTSVSTIIDFLIFFLSRSTVAIGCCMTHVYCERLDKMFRIINNIDSQLKQANIGVIHWQITLKAMVLTLITVHYSEIVFRAQYQPDSIWFLMAFSFHFLYMWTILLMLIINERFVCFNKLLQENATTNIQIIDGRNPRDSHMLRRISLARHVHEQLTEVVQLFSDTCRYAIIGLITVSIISSIAHSLPLLIFIDTWMFKVAVVPLVTHLMRIFIFIGICQKNKAERRVFSARLRHLVAFETDREIIHQVQQYIMYNAYSVQGLIDFQFTDIDNILLLTIIDVIASNVLIIYSYTRSYWDD